MEICSGHIHGRRLKPSTSKDICWGSNHPTNLKQGFKNTVLSVDIGVNSPPEEPQLCTFCQSQCEHGRIWSYSMEYNNFPQLKPCFTEQKAFGTENKVAILIIKIYTLSSDTKQIFPEIIQIPRASLSFLACVTLGCSSLTAHQDTTTHHGEKLQQWLNTEERFVKPSFNRNKSWWAQPKLWGSVMVWKLDLCPGGICSLPHVHSAGCCIATVSGTQLCDEKCLLCSTPNIITSEKGNVSYIQQWNNCTALPTLQTPYSLHRYHAKACERNRIHQADIWDKTSHDNIHSCEFSLPAAASHWPGDNTTIQVILHQPCRHSRSIAHWTDGTTENTKSTL